MNKKILILTSHFSPSNLTSVHRSRLFAKHLPSFSWDPIIISVHERYYEEPLDEHIGKLLDPSLRIEKVSAIPNQPLRLVGDVGIRGFFPLLFKVLSIIKKEEVHFLYITIPSNFVSLIGPIVNRLTKLPYGIDYIDPWVHKWPGTEKKFSKHWWMMKLGEWLEPIAVKKASLITGVAPGYYLDVLYRNPKIRRIKTASMPYGGEVSDHTMVKKLGLGPYLFKKSDQYFDFVYAGAMLPNAYQPLEAIFKAIKQSRKKFEKTRFHFIGTGKSPKDKAGYNIKPIAEKYGLWNTVIYEYPARIPYLDVLAHLAAAGGAFILGSTEPHYTPSKVFQSVLSGRPIFAILHQESSACKVIEGTGSGKVLSFDGENDLKKIEKQFAAVFADFINYSKAFKAVNPDHAAFQQYSAASVTSVLAKAIDEII